MNSNPIDLTTVALVTAWLGNKSDLSAQEQAQVQAAITAASNYWLWKTGRGSGSGAIPAASPFNQAIQYSERYNGNGNEQLFLRNNPIISVQSLSVNGVAVPASGGDTVPGYLIDTGGKSLIIRGGIGYAPGYGYPFGAARVAYSGGRSGGFPNGVQNVAVVYTAGFPAGSVVDELETIPVTPGPYVVAVQDRFLSDSGVKFFIGGTALARVNVAPATGEYYVVGGGVYQFAAADQGKQVLISYAVPGTPPDVEVAARQMVAVNYKRRSWIDQTSQAMANGAGTTSYRSWELPPEVLSVMDNYSRNSFIGG